jgi:hypothetical protein
MVELGLTLPMALVLYMFVMLAKLLDHDDVKIQFTRV